MGTELTQTERDELIALQAEKHKYQSDQGRIAKEQQARAEAEKQAEAYRARIAELESARPADQPAAVPDSLKEIFGATGAGDLGTILQNVQRKATEDAVKIMEARFTASSVSAKFSKGMADWEVNAGADGFLRRVSENGDLAESWAAFKEANPAAAYAERYRDPAAMGGFLDMFAKSKGIEFTITPRPVSGGGRYHAMPTHGKSYTDEDYGDDLERINTARMNGDLKPAEYDRERAFIDQCRGAGEVVSRE